jgi:hypothetical protein
MGKPYAWVRFCTFSYGFWGPAPATLLSPSISAPSRASACDVRAARLVLPFCTKTPPPLKRKAGRRHTAILKASPKLQRERREKPPLTLLA